MTPEQRTLLLLDPLYRAGIDLDAWRLFVEAFASELGGAAIAITSEETDWVNPQEFYWTRLKTGFAKLYQLHAEKGLPWGPLSDPIFRERFCLTSSLLPDEQLADTPFYREWMQPQGLACEGPLVHAAPYSERRPGWVISIFRVEGARAFENDDIALCNHLAPHLAINSLVFDSFSQAYRERVALSDVIDRVSSGIFLTDSDGRVLVANLGARRILEANDGIALEQGILRVDDAEAGEVVRKFIGDAIQWRGRDPIGAGGELFIPRRSGMRPYIATIMSMEPADRASAFGDDVAVVLVADPSADQTAAAARIRSNFQLTDAQTDLVRLIAEGLSLEEISRERGVTMNTTRTHLKHVFSKTGTNRQSELVGMVLSAAVPRGQ